MGSRRYGARFGTAVANVGDLNLDGYEGKQWSYTLTLRRLMSYIYGAPILDVSRSHTTTQHSR